MAFASTQAGSDIRIWEQLWFFDEEDSDSEIEKEKIKEQAFD